MSQFWRRISLKSDVVRQSYGNIYRVIVFSWTQCRTVRTTPSLLCSLYSATATVQTLLIVTNNQRAGSDWHGWHARYLHYVTISPKVKLPSI